MDEILIQNDEKVNGDMSNSAQPVSVGKTISYRQQAQAAEEQLRQVQQQLQEQQQQQESLQEDVAQARLDRELMEHLAGTGVTDMEAAMLLAKKRVARDDQPEEIKSKLATLQQEKPYLFQGRMNGETLLAAAPTAGVKSRAASGREQLRNMARHVQKSTGRRMMREYLRLRRTLMP